jgi:murein L,D-transpeptidase YcbB/YkuD
MGVREVGRRFVGGAAGLATACALAQLVAAAPARAGETAELLSHRVEALRAGAEVRIGSDRIASSRVLPDFYEREGFTLAWTRDRAEELLGAVLDSETHGLDPNDYHRPEIEDLLARDALDAAEQVDLDLLLTDALVRLAYHLVFGKVDPERLDAHWNLAREIEGVDPVEALRATIGAPSVAQAAAGFAPQHPAYARFRGALARYRELAARGGFEPVPDGPKLEPGAEGPRVEALRRRLAAEGDLPEEQATGALFDAALEAAVKRAQERYGLDPDGVVGRATLAALNVPVDARVDQIRVNLERARWVLYAIEGRLVLVDIAGFRLRYFDPAGDWTTRVVVGRPYRKTPVFRSTIRYLVLNPTWTVPPTIFAQDILPAVRKDPGYLAKKRLRVIDSRGGEVDPRSIDWAGVSARGFPYQLRQDPGPDNALGLVKFMFPNSHSVYLHDTPSRALFEKAERAASSGCIRVEQPLRLAELLLADPERWSREALERAIESGRTQTVNLPEPVPVILMYWTVDVAPDGSVSFKPDLYERDPGLLRALEDDFSFRRRALGGGQGL